MATIIGLTLFSIFFVLAALHFYWGFGGKLKGSAAVPTNANSQPIMVPGIVSCFGVGLTLLGFGLLVLIKAGLFSFALPYLLLDYGLWSIAAIFVLRAIGEFKYVGFFKKIKDTPFGKADTKYYSPLCLLIGILAMILELL